MGSPQVGTKYRLVGEESTVVSLLGTDYTWPAPARRVRRAMVVDFVEIEALLEEGKVNPTKNFAAIDKMLDFFFKYHAEMERDNNKINDNATEEDIQIAFWGVYRFVMLPFSDVMKSGSAEPTSSPNP